MQSDVNKTEAKLPKNDNLDLDFGIGSASRSELSDSTLTESDIESAAVEIKGSMFTLPVLHLQSGDMDLIAGGLSRRLAHSPGFFEHAPVVIELGRLGDQADTLDLSALCTLLRQARLIPVGVRQASAGQARAAIEAGLAVLKGGGGATPRSGTAASARQATATSAVTKQVDSPSPKGEVTPAKVVRQPVRSGQQIYARGGDLILLAAVNAGAEVIADGNIHAYAPLRGRALAGVLGDVSASIFAQAMEAELVAIAGQYQVFEDGPAKNVGAGPVRIFLDGTHIKVSPLAA